MSRVRRTIALRLTAVIFWLRFRESARKMLVVSFEGDTDDIPAEPLTGALCREMAGSRLAGGGSFPDRDRPRLKPRFLHLILCFLVEPVAKGCTSVSGLSGVEETFDDVESSFGLEIFMAPRLVPFLSSLLVDWVRLSTAVAAAMRASKSRRISGS
jgi:hypothetical protein